MAAAEEEGEEQLRGGGDGGGGGRGGSVVSRWRDVVEERWTKAGEHAEAYPYVWASYAVVYGGLGAFLAYKWRKFRRMEDRVRVLQERVRRQAEAEAEARAQIDRHAPRGPREPSP